MLSLRELQGAFAAWILQGAAAPDLAALVEGDGWPVEERLDIHRNNVFASLTKALAATFPATLRLVGEGFFAYAAHEFIASRPPTAACLAFYGVEFADFLAAFAPSRSLAYLPDVARLEWLMHRAGEAGELAPLPPGDLAGFAEEDVPRLVFTLQPSIAYLCSPFPVDRIWTANRTCGSDDRIELDGGEAMLEVRRVAGDVVYRRLDRASFAFRAQLAGRVPLAEAAEAALAEDPGFDLTQALPALFQEEAVIAAGISPHADQERT